MAAQQQHLQQQQGSNGNGSSLSNNQNAAQQLLAAQLAQLQAAQLAQLGWGNQELASLYNPLQSMTGLNPLASLGLGVRLIFISFKLGTSLIISVRRTIRHVWGKHFASHFVVILTDFA